MIEAVSRRVRFSEDTGMSCGAFDESAVDAELVLEDQGRRVFLCGQWTDQMPDRIRMEAVPESLYEISEQMDSRGSDWGDLAARRERILKSRIDDPAAAERYAPYFEELRRMIVSELEAHGYRIPPV